MKTVSIDNLKIDFDLGEDGFSFCVPEIGLFTQGNTRDELANNVKDGMSISVKKGTSLYKKLNKFFRFDSQYVAN